MGVKQGGVKEKRRESRDDEPGVEGSQPEKAGFFVVGDRVGRRREEFASGGGQIGRGQKPAVEFSWGATSASEWANQGERPTAVRTT